MVITKRHLRFIIRTTRAGPASTLGMDRHQHSETYFPWITAFNSQNNLWGQGVPLLQSGNWGKMRVSYFHVRSPWWSLDSYPNYKLRSLSCHVFIFFLMTHSLFHLTNDLHTPPLALCPHLLLLLPVLTSCKAHKISCYSLNWLP